MNSFEELENSALRKMREAIQKRALYGDIEPGQVLHTLDDFIAARKLQEQGVIFQVRGRGTKECVGQRQGFNALSTSEYRRAPEPEPKWVEISATQAAAILARQGCFPCQVQFKAGEDWAPAKLYGVRLCGIAPFYIAMTRGEWTTTCRIDTNEVKLP